MFLDPMSESINAVVNRQMLVQAGVHEASATLIAEGVTARDSEYRLDPVDARLAAVWWRSGVTEATIATQFVGSEALPTI